jgi:hypothetical protein
MFDSKRKFNFFIYIIVFLLIFVFISFINVFAILVDRRIVRAQNKVQNNSSILYQMSTSLPTIDTPDSQKNMNKHVLRLLNVLQGCGEICDHSKVGQPSLFFNYIQKNVDCKALWNNEAIDEAMVEDTPPTELPAEMIGAFTYDGLVPLQYGDNVRNDRYLGKTALQYVWRRDFIDDLSALCRDDKLEGSYGLSETMFLKMGLAQMNLPGSNVLVIGSESPWVEACVLNAGAASVTTLEYGSIQSEHPKVHTLTPKDFRLQYSKFHQYFDAVVTFSSVEHSGLGRYGDALNPWGDRQAIARSWCASKPGAFLLIAVMSGDDAIAYNLHRIYGEKMYPHLVANWEQVWRASGGVQVVHVLRKKHDEI